ncbi:MAG: hypothetical protein ACRDL4_05375, partial [Thermoleophilaceae bacterium]
MRRDKALWRLLNDGRMTVVAEVLQPLAMLIGPASDGTLLELGVLDLDGDDPVVIHAMRLRPRFHSFL